MKNNFIQTIVSEFIDKYGECNRYSLNKLFEIATNCTALSEAWFNGVEKGYSFEIHLYDKDGEPATSLHGVTRENLPKALLEINVLENNKYSKVTLDKFKYDERGNKNTEIVGELEIS